MTLDIHLDEDIIIYLLSLKFKSSKSLNTSLIQKSIDTHTLDWHARRPKNEAYKSFLIKK